MNKKAFILLFLFASLAMINVQAQNAQTGTGLESLLDVDNDDRPLTKAEMKDLWKKMKKLEKEDRNSLTENMSTYQVKQMKEWLGKQKTTRLIGGWMMILSPVVLAGVPAIGRATSNEYYSDGKKRTPEWAQTIAGVGFPVMLVGGAVLWGRGNKRYNTSRLLIVDTPVLHDFDIMNYHANAGLQIINDPITNQYTIGTGVSIAF